MITLLLVLSLGVAQAADEQQVRPLLTRHCSDCHSGDKPKGNFNLDQLESRWASVLEQLEAGTMPPKGKPRPSADERKGLLALARAKVDAAEAARRAVQGRVVLRRLNR